MRVCVCDLDLLGLIKGINKAFNHLAGERSPPVSKP